MAQRAYPMVRTADDLELLPEDGNRYELIDGVLFVTPAPHWLHQRALIQFAERLLPYVRDCGLELFVAPTAVRASLFTEVEPDLAVVPRVSSDHKSVRWLPMPTAMLVVEVLSPSTADRDRSVKRRTYQLHGVGEYWVVDLDLRVIDVWRERDEAPYRETATLRWQPISTHPPLAIDLHDFFLHVEGEG